MEKELVKVEGEDSDENLSYMHIQGEWEDRKISLFGVVKSFISQLSAGQDLTRVSLPCVFCRPYSLLEEIAARNISQFDRLFEVPKKRDPLERVLTIISWFIGTARQEKFHHKPFNPVIGEQNRCKKKHSDKEGDTTFVLVEQVKHHPPTSGLRIDNAYRGISIEGHYTFEVQFNRNSVSVTNAGKMAFTFGDEHYLMDKPMPNLMIRNIILGSKLVSWEGELAIKCAETGYSASFELTTKGRTNLVKGGVYDGESSTEPVAIVDGKCGGPAYWFFNVKHPRFVEQEKNLGKKEKKAKRKEWEEKRLLVEEPGSREDLIPTYPKNQPENSSFNLWKPVREAIIKNDMEVGDAEKMKIEQKQRALFAGLAEDGETHEPEYFTYNEETERWGIKDPNWWHNYYATK